MLVHLSIKNYALIESLSVNFQDNLSIITGETGAGKSILLGALGLVLGKRADSSTLKDASKKCIIEARFSISNYNLNAFFEEKDLDFDQETIIRREILPSGKSRAFINDTPTTIQTLQLLSEKLIDVHSQHQTVQLSDGNFQFYIIDALAANSAKIESYKRELIVFNKLTKELKTLAQEQKNAKEQYEYNLHLYTDLEKANLKVDEQETLERQLDKENNIEETDILYDDLDFDEIKENEYSDNIVKLNYKDIMVESKSDISDTLPRYDEKYMVLEVKEDVPIVAGGLITGSICLILDKEI